MLWSLGKVAFFFAAVAAMAWGGNYLLQSDQGIYIKTTQYEFTIGIFQAVVLLCLALVALWLVLRIMGFARALVRFVRGDATALSRYFDQKREKRGYDALFGSMTALAGGEPKLALNEALKAQKLLQRPEVTGLFVAQAAQALGDKPRAEAAYKLLLDYDRTRFVGIRGLMGQKITDGDYDTALALAQKAFALKPKHGQTQDILLKLQTENQDWKGARDTLAAKWRSGDIGKDVFRRRDAVLALQQARGVLDEGATVEAREAAIAANKSSPDLIPAAVMAAQHLAKEGDVKSATRILKKAWEAQPHPDLAAAFAAFVPDETSEARLKRFQPLLAVQTDNPETKMLHAELLIATEDFPAARRAMGDLAEKVPTGRSLALMAAIAKGEGGDDAQVRGWLARALSAPKGPQWCCDACLAVQAEWGPICAHCQGFDTLSWRDSSVGSAPLYGADLLPLLVSSPAPPEAVETIEEPPKEPIDLAAIARSAN